MEIINKRYRIVRELSSDAYGIQYLVQDLALKQEKLILKLIHPQYANTDYIQYFTEEFLDLASIQHANIQQDFRFDIIKTIDNRTAETPLYFFTSEYIDIDHTLNYRALDYTETMKVLIELCYIVNYLHFRDVVYKYLSFDSFWIYRVEGQIKIKLKSMASMYGYSEVDRDQVEQISQFFSPEIRKNNSFTPNADIFSLGVVTYYLLNQKDYRDSEIKGQFTRYASNPIINDLINKSVTYDADERYATIEEFLVDFEKVCPYSYDFNDKKYYQRLNFNTKLVGRERILDDIVNGIFRRLQNMSGTSSAMVSGNPGMGKSRILREIYYRVRLSNINAYTYEVNLGMTGAYICFSELIKEMARTLSPVDELILKYGSELVKIIPEMRNLWNIEPTEALKEDREKLKINNRIVNFIVDYSLQHPVLLIIDNVGILNENEKAILDNLMNLDKEIPLFVLFSFDEEEEIGATRLEQWLLSGKTKRFELDNFSIHEASEHIKNVLSMSHTPTRLASYIVSETYGNPRYVEEVIKNLFLHEYIYIHERRKWFVTQDDLTEIDLPESLDLALADSYHSVEENSKRILEAIAIYNKPIAKGVLLSMTNMLEDDVAERIQQLIELKILGIKYSDWGFTYDFHNKSLGRLIVHELSTERKIELHQAAALIIESYYLIDGTNGDSLIYHLENANQITTAIPYALEMAIKMKELNIYSQAIEFYQKAMDLVTQMEDHVMLCKVEKAIAEIYIKTGEVDKAQILFNEVMSLADANDVIVDYVDAAHQIINIKLLKREPFEYNPFLDAALKRAKAVNYINGILENGLLRSKWLVSKGDLSSFEEVVDEYLRLSFKHQNDYYIGRMLNQKGLVANLRESYNDAFKSYVESIKYLERSIEPSESSRPLNNLGVIALNAIGDVQSARDYFKRAVDASERYNIVSGKDVYLCNLGETYILEDQLDIAIEKIVEAEKIASDDDNKEIKFQIYYNLGLCYLNKRNFKETARYLRKIEQEYMVIQSIIQDIGFDNYYLLSLEFALKCRDFPSAQQHLKALEKDQYQFADSYSHYNLKLLRFYFIHISHPEWESGYLDLEYLRVIKSIAASPIEEKFLRVILAEMILDLLANKLDESAMKLYTLYQEVDKTFSTERLDLLEVALGCVYATDRSRYIEGILIKYRLEMTPDVLWRMYKILAESYDASGEYYYALLNYLNGLDTLKGILVFLPEENRMSFLMHDKSKIYLRQRIDDLIHSIYDEREAFGHATLINAYEDYFAVHNLPLIFENKVFLDSVKKAYQKRFDMVLEDAEDLFKYFKMDQQLNLELVIKYQMQLCLAESACLYLVNENGQLVEMINPTPEYTPPELKNLLKNRTIGGEGIVTPNNVKNTNFADDREAIIFMPVYRVEDDVVEPARRKYDPLTEKQVVVGYLYFSTDKLLNNFTSDAFEDIASLRNLLVVLIDNYDLKKASSVDKLTGVYQRRFIEHQFKRVIAESSRNGSLLSIVMADIDHFKNVNDVYGHQKGDEVLRKIGDLLKSHVRKGDLVGRYGGEEFIILLPKTGEMDAYIVCEKLRTIISDMKLLGEDQTLTLSFGSSTYPLHGSTEAELIEKADKALYESKNNGRNMTTLWSPNLIYNNQRYDKLAGILTGNLSNDTRVVKSIVDIISFVTQGITKRDKLKGILAIIIDIIEAFSITVVYEREGAAKQVFTRNKGTDVLLSDQTYNEELYVRYKEMHEGDFFIHWNDAEVIDPILKTPNWKSYCIVPIHQGDKRIGTIMAMVSINTKEFDFNDFNFIQTISGLLSKL